MQLNTLRVAVTALVLGLAFVSGGYAQTSPPWTVTGNAGTNANTNFVGTTDNVPLRLKANKTEGIVIMPNGNVGVGLPSNVFPTYRLEVLGGTKATYNASSVPAIEGRNDGGSHGVAGFSQGSMVADPKPFEGPPSFFGAGVYGENLRYGAGVYGRGQQGPGTYGTSLGSGVKGEGFVGVEGVAITGGAGGVGVKGQSGGGIGVQGISTSNIGVAGSSTANDGISGTSKGRNGIMGSSQSVGASGVYGENLTGGGYGVAGRARGANAIGVLGDNPTGLAGKFVGKLRIEGSLETVGGAKNFVIDHPLDPLNKYLYHAAIESPELLNVYSGNILTNAEGKATVRLPAYFESLNADFRYQLTVVGQMAQAVVLHEIEGSQFVIMTDKPSVKVSWQVSGRRQDAYAKAHPMKAEVDKPLEERGRLLFTENPSLASTAP